MRRDEKTTNVHDDNMYGISECCIIGALLMRHRFTNSEWQSVTSASIRFGIRRRLDGLSALDSDTVHPCPSRLLYASSVNHCIYFILSARMTNFRKQESICH